MMVHKHFLYVALGFIFLLACLLRFYKLSDFPVGFHIDEASLGYNGYSLLLTGKDDNGNAFPLYIDMFGDNRPSGYHYLTVLPIKLFGLNESATRFPAAFFGSITVFAMYFLSYVIFRKTSISLLSSFLVAVAPWHIVLSRASGEVIVALFFILLGFACLLHGIKKQRERWVIAGSICLSISFFFYHTPRVFVPLLFLGFLSMSFLYRKKFPGRLLRMLVGCFLFVCLVVVTLVFSVKGGTGRFAQVNIFGAFETSFQEQQWLREDATAGDNRLLSRIVHNQVTNLGLIFVGNYLSYFSPEFLFVKGGLPIWYNVPRMGLLYLIELPFVFIGLLLLVNNKNIFHKIPLIWIVSAPIVAAITNDDVPNINRAAVMFPMFHILCAVSFVYISEFLDKRKKIILISSVLFIFFFNILYFFHQYFINAKTNKPWFRNNGFSHMMKIVRDNYQQYNQIVISKYQGGIYPLVLFYMRYDPLKYQIEGSPKNKDYGGFGKFIFVPQDCPSVQKASSIPYAKKVLYIDKGDCPDDKSLIFKKYSYIEREDNTKAFRIIF